MEADASSLPRAGSDGASAIEPEPVRLTGLSPGAGCACKVPADRLEEIVASLPAAESKNLLVGAGGADDAAVFRIGERQALVHTADFFTPIVDDPADFGRIAAANALSDVYAMGGRPLVALNLVAFSLDALGGEVLAEILRGGADVVTAAGAVIGGGHTIDDAHPKYGLAVSGLVDPERMLVNSAGRPGDLLKLTKPIGAGVVTTAAKRDLAEPEVLRGAIAVMTELNADAATAAVEAGARAATDVTGFGLLGHLHELCRASGLAARLRAEEVPLIPGSEQLAADPRCRAGGSERNRARADGFATYRGREADSRRFLLSDAMTSGGLLIAAPPAVAESVPGVEIGELRAGDPGTIEVI